MRFMTKTARLGLMLPLLACGALPWTLGCSAIFDGHQYLSADAAATDASSDATHDSGPPDPCAGACGGATSICEPSGGTCVECLVDHDCTRDLVACDSSSHTCVACTADNTSACTGDTPVCDLGASACVACNVNTDCPSSTPVCTDHACVACGGEADCAGRVGAAACDSSSGACVECTAGSADVTCSTGVCTQGNTCSAFASAAQRACEPCDTDANCASMHRCVPMRYATAAHGSYCLKLASAGCDQPYSVASTATSLGGQAGPYCGIDEDHATCEAVQGLLGNVACPTGDDAECAEAGLCRQVGVLANRCTYECALASRCPATVTCGPGTTSGVSYCGG